MDSPGPTTELLASARPAPAARAKASARLPASTHTKRARRKVASFMFLSLVLSSPSRTYLIYSLWEGGGRCVRPFVHNVTMPGRKGQRIPQMSYLCRCLGLLAG